MSYNVINFNLLSFVIFSKNGKNDKMSQLMTKFFRNVIFYFDIFKYIEHNIKELKYYIYIYTTYEIITIKRFII